MNSLLFPILGIRSLEQVIEMLQGELADQVIPGDQIHLPFRGKETVFAILGVGVNPNPEDRETGNRNFIDLIMFDDMDKIYDTMAATERSRVNYSQTYLKERLQLMVEDFPQEIQDRLVDRKVLAPCEWSHDLPVKYQWESIGKVWIPSLTELSIMNCPGDITDQGEESYFRRPNCANISLDYALTRTKTFSGESIEMMDWTEDEEDEFGTESEFCRDYTVISANQRSEVYPCIRLRF